MCPPTASTEPSTPALQQCAAFLQHPGIPVPKPVGPNTLPAGTQGTTEQSHRQPHSSTKAPYLLVQPQELAVAHSAVQHPIHMDVVGLRGEAQVKTKDCSLMVGMERPWDLPSTKPPPSPLPKEEPVQEEATLPRTPTKGDSPQGCQHKHQPQRPSGSFLLHSRM